MTEDFFSPASINFSRLQIPWLIKHLSLLRIGSWPSDFKQTGYSGGPKRGQKHGSYFESPVSIAAELDFRIERAGLDGILLEFLFTLDPEDHKSLEQHLAQALRTDLDSIDKRIRTALDYVSGWKRKKISYKEFKAHRKEQRERRGA